MGNSQRGAASCLINERARKLALLFSGVQMENNYKIPPSQLGSLAFVSTVTGKPVTTQYAIVELASLTMSNHLNGAVNELYPQDLQPRDRTQPESVEKVWNSSKGIALSWLSKSDSSATGSPITGKGLIVESGNGRSMAIRKAYYDGVALDYRAKLEQASEQFGIDTEVVQVMREPVLIRIRLTEMDAAEFARDSNHDNDATSQADKSIIVNMYESVSDDIESAADVGAIKMALVAMMPANRDSETFIEDTASVITQLVKPSFISRNIKAFSENVLASYKLPALMEASSRESQRIFNLAAVEIFGTYTANAQWIEVLRVTPDLFDFEAMYDAMSGTDYEAAYKAYRWKTTHKGRFKNGMISAELVNQFTTKKITKIGLKRFVDSSLDAMKYDNNPISSLVAENQFIIDHLTSDLDNPPEMPQAEQMSHFAQLLINSEVTKSFPEGEPLTIELLANALTTEMQRQKAALIERMASENRKTMDEDSAIAAANREADGLFSLHLTPKIVENTKGALERFFNNNELPPAGQVGIACYSAMKGLNIKRTYGSTIEKVNDYLESVIDEYEPVKEPTKEVRVSADSKLAELGLTFDKDLKPHIDSFAALSGGTLPAITFEYGDTCPKDKKRAYAIYNTISIGDKPNKDMIWHEYGHMVENNHPEIKSAALALIRSRHSTATNKPVITKLKKYRSWAGDDEYMVDNHKADPYECVFYTPNIYHNRDFDFVAATELISMGFQWLSDEKEMHKLMQDSALFKIVMAAIALMKGKSGQ